MVRSFDPRFRIPGFKIPSIFKGLSKKPAPKPDWVPPRKRKQVYLPEFKIALIRTPFLPPRFASFYVPLSFNKLDMRDYLRNAYGVKILNVRSVVEQQKITRMRRDGSGIGPYRRPQSRKKMTVEMTEPFVWPDPPEDMSPWEQDRFLKAQEYEREHRDRRDAEATKKPDTEDRESFEKAAKEILEGERTWKPTWETLADERERAELEPKNSGEEGSQRPSS